MAAAVGGGFNGKSTLLQAIEAGVYDKVQHRPGQSPALQVNALLHRTMALLPSVHWSYRQGVACLGILHGRW